MNNFQTIILGIFGFFIIAGLLAVSMARQSSKDGLVSISVWGSAPRSVMDEIIRASFDEDKLRVSYTEVSENAFDQNLLEALAAGRGPDMVLLPLELLLRYKDKLQTIPFTNYTERTFKDNFIQEGDLFLSSNGIYALPFMLDPLVMYFNRDFLDEAGMSQAPKYWDEFITLGKNLTLRDDKGAISRSAVALGEYRNVNYAREILAALLLQSGTPVVSATPTGPRVALTGGKASSVLNFYTEFANPLKPVYSWNGSLPNSKSAFLASRLGVYFGLGSEWNELRKANPNLNFDVALFPKPRDLSVGTTYGKLTGSAILRTSSKASASLQVAYAFASPQVGKMLHAQTGLPPVQRILLTAKPTDSYGAIMYDSAGRSRGFLDPNPKISADVFRTMIESVTNGKMQSSEALNKAEGELQRALR